MIIGNLPQSVINNGFYKNTAQNRTPNHIAATVPDTFTRTAVSFKNGNAQALEQPQVKDAATRRKMAGAIDYAASHGEIEKLKELHAALETEGDFETLLLAHLRNSGSKRTTIPDPVKGTLSMHFAIQKGSVDVVKEIHRLFKPEHFDALKQIHLSQGNNWNLPMHEAAEHGQIEIVREIHDLFKTEDFDVLKQIHLTKNFEGNLPMHEATKHGDLEIVKEIHGLFESKGDYETLKQIHLSENRYREALSMHEAARCGQTDVIEEIHGVFESQGDYETLKQIHLTKNRDWGKSSLPMDEAISWHKSKAVEEIHRVFKDRPEILIQIYLNLQHRAEDFITDENTGITLPNIREIRKVLGKKGLRRDHGLFLPAKAADIETLEKLDTILASTPAKSKKIPPPKPEKPRRAKPATPALPPPKAKPPSTVPKELDFFPLEPVHMREELKLLWNIAVDEKSPPLLIEADKNYNPMLAVGMYGKRQEKHLQVQAVLVNLFSNKLLDKYANPELSNDDLTDRDKDLKRFGAYCIQAYLMTLPNKKSLNQKTIQNLWIMCKTLACNEEFRYSSDEYQEAKINVLSAIRDKIETETKTELNP